MSMDFEELVSRSGDSKLLDYHFSNGELTIRLEMEDLDKLAVINIPTNFVYGEKKSLSKDFFCTCRLDLINLSNLLNIEKGFYIPNPDFGKMMKEIRSGASFAYGQRCSDLTWLLNIVGYSRTLSCLIAKLEQITWQLED